MIKIKKNRTKIVATIGPSSSSYKTLKDLIINGVDVVRLNFSHGIHDDHKKIIKNVRKISDELSVPVSILQDLQGPKIRVGKLNKDSILLNDGDEFFISSGNKVGTKEEISIDNDIIDDIKSGERILIDDGKIELKVVETLNNKIKVEVIRGGKLLKKRS